MLKKLPILIGCALLVGWGGHAIGLNTVQCVAVSVFSASILGTLIFWEIRLAFAFLGTALLFITRSIDMEHFIEFASLDVILFLVGMMVLIGLLKESGLFTSLSRLLLGAKKLTARKFVILVCFVSALLAGMVDEVTSIIFMVAAILDVCDRLKVNPVPYIVMSVLATNIGSMSTVLGNPIGILIATKSGLTFEDFIVKALPLAMVCLVATIGILLVWYRKVFAAMDEGIVRWRGRADGAGPEPLIFSRGLAISLAIFAGTLIVIALHHRLENLFGVGKSTIMLIAPLVASGIIFIWKGPVHARRLIEKDVEWWTLLFFMFLFAQAGTLRYTGVTGELAKHLTQMTSANPNILISSMLWIASIGSSILDNVVLVAAMTPIVQSFKDLGLNLQPLWWALLFGGCLGGNITLVGSTANIVALGILEKQKNIRITFMQWVGIGLTVGVVTTCIAWLVLLLCPFYRG